MLACLLDGPHKVSLKQVVEPRLDPGDILVKMEACGICGTDLEKIEGQLGPGGILGHELSGTIEKTTDSQTDYVPGDRVVAHHHVPCYRCQYCVRGDMTMCDEFKKTNVDPCGLAEYFRVPKYNVERGAIIPLPARLSYDEGALIEPTACCIRAITRAKPREKDNVLVIGLGPTGLTHIQLLRAQTSAKIVGTDIIKSRLDAGAALGADLTLNPTLDDIPNRVKNETSGGVDIALVATGNEKALYQAFASVRKGGKVLLFGAPAQGANYHLDVSRLFSQQLSLISSYSCVEAEMHEAIRMVSEKHLDLASMISDRYELAEAERAFEHAKSSRTTIKTVITA